MSKRVLHILFLLSISSFVWSQTNFKDVTSVAGINHAFKVYEGMFGGGACVLDYNKDGWEDVYITGGTNDDVLYRNNRNGSFTNVFDNSGLSITRKFVTQGVASADVNRDGFPDLLVTTITSRERHEQIPREINLFFINNGNGTFRDATKEYGLDQMFSFSTAVSFGDINADGWPDAYIGNYFNDYKGKLSVINDATVVGANQIAKGYLLMNQNGKKFKDAYADYGLNFRGFGFGGVFTDHDNDGDIDLFINHDFGYKRTADMMLDNQYPWKSLKDIAPQKGLDLKINSMSTAVGDYSGDGYMDYYVTNIGFNAFMVSEDHGKRYVNKAKDLGLGYFAISWGTNFADFDHDGDLDLFVANGDLNPNCVPMSDNYFENNGKGFSEKASMVGLADYGIGRGSVTFDYDNDGDLDLLVVNQIPVLNYPTTSFTRLYRNDLTKGNWIKIKLKGVDAESNGLGSRVEIEIKGKKMIREIDGGGSSHISQNSIIAHFGLGQSDIIDKITVHWIGGNETVLKNVSANRTIIIQEKTSFMKKQWKVAIYLLGALAVVVLAIIYRRRKKEII